MSLPIIIRSDYLSPTRKELVCHPSKVLDYLYLGSVDDIKPDFVEKNKITGIIICCDNTHTKISGIEYLELPIKDSLDYPIKNHFEESHLFINRIKQTGKVFVCCRAGISRSPSIVLSYLMTTYPRFSSYDIAYDFLAGVREIICPNIGFCVALHDLEKELTSKVDV